MPDENFSPFETGVCTGSFCPVSPKELEALHYDEDVILQSDDQDCRAYTHAIAQPQIPRGRSHGTETQEDLLNPAVNVIDRDLQAETSQTLRYLEDQVIAMREQLDRLLDSNSGEELSAIAHSYTLLEQGKSTELKLIEPEMQSVRAYFKSQSQKPDSSIIGCLLDLQKKLLILINSESHEITLAFAFRPTGKGFEPIKMLRLYDFIWLMKQFKPFEFTFGFARVCDLKAIAWAVAMEYRALGYSCRIECGGEVIDVDELIAEASPSALWLQLQEVRLCA